MGVPLKKVSPGDPLNIPADTFNTFIDVAQAFRDRQQFQAGGFQFNPTPTGIVTVRNDTGTHLSRFYVAAVTGVVITPADNETEFKNHPAFVASLPTADTLDKCVILMEPIAAGGFGRAMILGVSPVQIDVQDEAHEYATPKSGTTDYLESATVGSFRILWKDSGTGVKWAVVLLGSPAASSLRRAKITEISAQSATVTVKNLDAAGNETGDAFQVYVLPSKASVTFASRYPKLIVGAYLLYQADTHGTKFIVVVEPVLDAITCDK